MVKKNPTYQCRRHKRCWFDPWVRKILWRRKWQTTPEFWPGKFCGHRSLASSYSPWGYKESDTTEHTIHIHITSLVLMYLLTISLYLLTTFVTIQSWYCINNDYIPHTENFIPVTHFATGSLHLLISLIPPFPSLWQPPVCSLFLFCYVY